MTKKNNDNPEKKPKVHKELEGFNMNINTFGEISSNFEVDKINKFLDENVPDKKFLEKDEPLPVDEEE